MTRTQNYSSIHDDSQRGLQEELHLPVIVIQSEQIKYGRNSVTAELYPYIDTSATYLIEKVKLSPIEFKAGSRHFVLNIRFEVTV